MVFILPIGHERTEVRRAPVVSLVILALNVLFFIGTYVRLGPAQERDFEAAVSAVADYLLAHPYLTLDPELERKLLTPDERRELEAALAERRAALGRAPTAAERETAQAELDSRCRTALRTIDATYAFRWGFVPAHPTALGLVTSMFVHAGWLHLLGNMLFFYLSGPFLEDVLGRPMFALFYLAGGVAAVAAHVLVFPDSTAPLVGASGAIAGLMGGFLVRFHTLRIRFAYALLFMGPMLLASGRGRGTFWAPAYLMLPLWLAGQVFYALLLHDQGGVAFWAHIGGFAFGAGAGLLLRAARYEERFVGAEPGGQEVFERPPDVVRGAEAREAGRLKQSRWHLERAVAAEPGDPDAHLELARTAAAQGDEPAARRHIVEHASLAARSGNVAAASAAYHEAELLYPGLAWPASVLLAVGRFLERDGAADAALRAYDRLASQHPSDPAAVRALAQRAGILARAGDRAGAIEALRAALALPHVDDRIHEELATRARTLAVESGLPPPQLPRRATAGAPPPVAGPPVRRRPPVGPASAR